ncbi:MAG: HNH endonuclease signature motif containing protein [Clostridia bacterium]
MAIKKQCNKAGCKNLIPRNQKPPYCENHLQEVKLFNSKIRQEQKDKYDDFYNSKEWKKTRAYILLKHNYICVECKKNGELQFADTVHHKKPIKNPGGWELRLVESNLVPLCRSCHNKEHAEKGGYHNG